MAEQSVGEITATLRLKDALTPQLNLAVKELEKIGPAATKLDGVFNKVDLSKMPKEAAAGFNMLKAAAVTAGTAAGAAIVALAADVIKTAGHIADLRDSTGLTTTELQELGFAGKQVGIGMDEVVKGVQQLSKRVVEGKGATVGALHEIGLSVDALRAMTPGQMFETIGRALAAIPDPAKRTALAMALLGRGGADLQPLLLKVDELKKGAVVMSESTIENLDRVGDAWDRLVSNAKSAAGNILGTMIQMVSNIGQVTSTTSRANPFGGWSPTDQQNDAIRLMNPKAANAGQDITLSGPAASVASPDFIKRVADAKREIDGLTAAQKDQIGAALSLGAKMDDLADDYGLSDDAAKLFTGTMKESVKATKDADKVTEAYAKRVAEMGRQFTGAAVADQIKFLDDAVKQAGGTAHLSAFEHERLGKDLEQLRLQGATLTPALHDVWLAHVQLTGITSDLAGTIRAAELPAITELTKATEQWSAASLQAKWANTNLFNGKVSTSGLGNLGGTVLDSLGAKPSKSVSEMIFGLSSDAFGQQLGGVIQASFQGGGSLVKSAASFLGQTIGTNVVGQFGKSIVGTLGKTLGGAFNAIIPGVGALLGPLVGAVGGWFNDHLFGGKGKKANDLRDSIKEKFGDAAGAGLAEFVAKLGNAEGVQAAYDRFMKAGSVEAVQKAFEDLQKAAGAANTKLEASAKLLDKYGLSMDDLKSPLDRAGDAISDLTADYTALKAKGFGDPALARGMASGLNGILRAALDTGAKIPAALEPVMQELIRGGLLADDLKAKMGAVVTVTPWQDMKKAAEDFGVSVGELGRQFDQGKLTSDAQGAVDAWHLLVDNGASVGAVMHGMKDEISGIVQEALRLGLDLPENIKPIVDKFKEAGLLVDDTGKKLEGLDTIKYTHVKTLGEELAESMQPLLEKLDTLIERLTGPGGLGDSLRDLPSPKVTVDVAVNDDDYRRWISQNGGASIYDGVSSSGVDVAMASGGIVTGPTRALIGEAGPEAVIPLSDYNWGGGGSVTVNVNASGAFFRDRESLRQLAFEISTQLEPAVRHYGLAK